MQIKADHIPMMALGGAFLATGGGGDTLLGEIITQAQLTQAGHVDLLPLDHFGADDMIVAIGGVGSPTVMQEKPMNGQEAGWALEALENFVGKKASAVIAFEAGGMNALVPFGVAAERGIPVVDADGMGRAFPELQMESFSIYGVSPTPLAMAAELGDRLVIDHARSSEIAERLVRHFAVVGGGGQCISAEHVMDGDTASRVCIPGTISLCYDIGILLDQYANNIPKFVTALTNRLANTHYGQVQSIFEGKVTDIAREVRGGYDYGTLELMPTSAGDTTPVTILIKNEYLLALRAGKPIATTPDLICILDCETGRPITAETLRYGQRVHVLAIGAPERMRTPRALEVVSPRNFGFDYDYQSVEDIYSDHDE